MEYKKKLIEVALPLEAINREAVAEKSIRKGHPSSLHLWWARRPLVTARAVIWASIVDDPSAHPERFPTEESQNQERQRLFRILESLISYDNSENTAILDLAKAEIIKSTDNFSLKLIDPFSGGGSIPFEAQRLGLEAHAHDLNPVAVVINKAMIEIPPKFSNLKPVNPVYADTPRLFAEGISDPNALSMDVMYYANELHSKVMKKIGHLYPSVYAGKTEVKTDNIIAQIWCRSKMPKSCMRVQYAIIRNFRTF